MHIGHCESKGKTGMFEGKQLGMEIFGARNVAGAFNYGFVFA